MRRRATPSGRLRRTIFEGEVIQYLAQPEGILENLQPLQQLHHLFSLQN
jgi:hypothetical protein